MSSFFQIMQLPAALAVPNLGVGRSITQEGDGLICCKAEVGTNIECRVQLEYAIHLLFFLELLLYAMYF